MSDNKYDVVVWGATGFTGKWVAKHLFEQYRDTDIRWAMAGRNSEKLMQTADFIGDNKAHVAHLLADSSDEDSLRLLVRQTKVIISTVGPYAHYGSLLVKVCAEEGTDYVDLTGEVPWMRRMIDAHEAVAKSTGARIVHSCGFDSIPSDMGNYFIQQQAFIRFGRYLDNVQFAVLRMKGGASGGTIHSLINVIREAAGDKAVRKLLFNPYSLNPDASFKGPDGRDQSKVLFNKGLKAWTAPFVMAAINTRVVRRSNALAEFKYGEDFKYSETMVTGKGEPGYARAKSVAWAINLISISSVTSIGRKLLGMLLPSQGDGPNVDPDKPGFYVIQFDGSNKEGDALRVELKGDADPGYGSTSKMLAESALCLAQDVDKSEVGGGFWTPSTAMADHLLARLQETAGLEFKLIDA